LISRFLLVVRRRGIGAIWIVVAVSAGAVIPIIGDIDLCSGVNRGEKNNREYEDQSFHACPSSVYG
jgi:hypothetical protein